MSHPNRDRWLRFTGLALRGVGLLMESAGHAARRDQVDAIDAAERAYLAFAFALSELARPPRSAPPTPLSHHRPITGTARRDVEAGEAVTWCDHAPGEHDDARDGSVCTRPRVEA